MSRPKKVFSIILGLFLLFGLGTGLINVIAPDAASVSLNGENVEGWGSVPVAMIPSAIMGVIVGLMGAGITALFFRQKS